MATAHQSSKDKPRSSKCNHFCQPFDSHGYCPSCRDAGKGDDLCVTKAGTCQICASFTDEQSTKIANRRRYKKKHPTSQASDKDRDEVLGDSFESFSGSQAELEAAADHLFTSPPRPRPLSFYPLPLTTPGRTVPPTPSTALHHKVHSSVEKALDHKFDQKLGAFQANICDALKSMRDDFLKSQQGLADKLASSAVRTEPQTSVSASEPMDIEKALLFLLAFRPSKVRTFVLALPNIHSLFVPRRPLTRLAMLQSQVRDLIPIMIAPHILDLKSTLTSLNISQGPHICPHRQGRISPLDVDTGLPSPREWPLMIRNILKLTLIRPTIGMWLWLTSQINMWRR